MKVRRLVCFDSESTNGLDEAADTWLDNRKVDIISISHSSCYDVDRKEVSYSVCLLYDMEIPTIG